MIVDVDVAFFEYYVGDVLEVIEVGLRYFSWFVYWLVVYFLGFGFFFGWVSIRIFVVVIVIVIGILEI